MMHGYIVFDECNENTSKLYDTSEEAQHDMDNDISHVWSVDAVVYEVEVDD